MDIYIPSSGRADKLITLNSIPYHLRFTTTVVVPKNEYEAYKETVGNHCMVVAPNIPAGIGHARQWCCDHSVTKALMLDDDLVFATRRNDNKTRFRDSSPREVADLFAHIEHKLDEYAAVGVATREGGNRVTTTLDHNTRLLRVLAYRTDILRKEVIRFDQIPVMEDFYVALSLLTKGYENVKMNYMVQNQGGSNSTGGCSQYRTPEVQAAAAHTLHDVFPDFVKVVQKETKTAWGGGIRTDVNIQWKKALYSAEELVCLTKAS